MRCDTFQCVATRFLRYLTLLYCFTETSTSRSGECRVSVASVHAKDAESVCRVSVASVASGASSDAKDATGRRTLFVGLQLNS